MKPRDKVVTAQDVESSLYYCHLDCDQDEAVRESLQSGDEVQALLETKKRYSAVPPDQSGAARRKSLHWTPQPEGTTSKPPLKQYPHLQQPGLQQSITGSINRKPVGGAPPLPGRPSESDVSMTKKVLGPRPLKAEPPAKPPASPTIIFGKENVRPQADSELPPTLPPRTNSYLSVSDERGGFITPALPPRRPTDSIEGHHPLPPTPYDSRSSNSSRLSVSTFSSSKLDGFSLTLIRRDPSSGDQWNIGKVTKEDSLNSEGLSLQIHSPGYEKFAHTTHPSNDYDDPIYRPFARLLQTQRQKAPASSNRRSMFRSSADLSRGDPSEDPNSPSLLTTTDGVPTLCFLSPWDGICEFSTGASGRTLKCRHSPPFNGNDVDPVLRRLNSKPVSELRLNLPVLASSFKRPPLSASHSKSSFFTSHDGHRHSVSIESSRDGLDERDEWDDAEEERMDLSLGQERAGGGFGGKKAKLGKLIVEGEGLLMLDLVVAANMGFWWSLRNQAR
ncbi:MAG: hypothetical protein MMC23_006568 [Stictis urceolatum]|nr:hypothetical protein [Stictis urceolata]